MNIENKKINLRENKTINYLEFLKQLQGIDNEIYLIVDIMEDYSKKHKISREDLIGIVNDTNIIEYIRERYFKFHLIGNTDILNDIDKDINLGVIKGIKDVKLE